MEAVGEFLTAVGEALSPGDPLVFHLEAFVGTGDRGGPELSFLEMGSRVGGAEIPFLWREVHGADLMAAAASVQLGREPDSLQVTGDEVAGWLLVSPPVEGGRRVARCEWNEAGSDLDPYMYALPDPGTTIPDVGGYEHVGARFRFRGPDANTVEKSVWRVADSFRIVCD